MDFDPRSFDDPRDRDHSSRDRSRWEEDGRELDQGSRGGLSDAREREPLDVREVFTRDLELPRGPERGRVSARDSDVTLRGSEVRTLATVGAFRVVPAGDLRDGQERPLDPNQGDLRHLRDRAFRSARYPLLYRCWKQDGGRVLATVASPVVAQATESGAGRIEPLVLLHDYSHLAPMAGVA